MKLLNKKKLIYLFIFYLGIFISCSEATEKIKILYKINNSIITNIDIQNELNYLIALNNDLKNVQKKDSLEIAKNSLIREKIKTDEIKKFFIIENYQNEDLINNIIENLFKKLDLENVSEFKNYLETYEISIKEVKKKMKIELLWNQLIAKKFTNQLNIDENKIRKKIKDEALNYKDIIEYDLSEIVFLANNQQELNIKLKEIYSSIENIGFNNTANKFSISETSKFGGKIGKVKENQLSKIIKKELNKISVGSFTGPINLNNGFIIIKINDKEFIVSS